MTSCDTEDGLFALKSATTRLKKWCIEDALPFWAMHGVDPKGGFYERLLNDGTPDHTALRRVRVQARMLYCYAHAHTLDWFSAHNTIDHLSTYILNQGTQGKDAMPGKGFKGIAHLLNSDHSSHDTTRDTYAQAFIILSYAWKYQASNDMADLDIAKQTASWLDAHATHPKGGWVETVPQTGDGLPRRQNPHMHLFEAFMALYEASSEAQYLERAGDIYHLFKEHFFDQENGVLLEYFTDDWGTPSTNGNLIEPGHLMEWAWLLQQYQRLTGVDTTGFAMTLYQNAIKYGHNEKTGLLYDEVYLKGSITKPSFRSWPLTEHIKASLGFTLIDNDHMITHAATSAKLINLLLDTYLNVSIRGTWRDQYDADGGAINGPIQASTFYHLFCAAAEADKTITLLEES